MPTRVLPLMQLLRLRRRTRKRTPKATSPSPQKRRRVQRSRKKLLSLTQRRKALKQAKISPQHSQRPRNHRRIAHKRDNKDPAERYSIQGSEAIPGLVLFIHTTNVRNFYEIRNDKLTFSVFRTVVRMFVLRQSQNVCAFAPFGSNNHSMLKVRSAITAHVKPPERKGRKPS